MSTHNIYFHREIRKYRYFFGGKKCLIKSYVLLNGPDHTMRILRNLLKHDTRAADYKQYDSIKIHVAIFLFLHKKHSSFTNVF